MIDVHKYLTEADSGLFFSKGDPNDRRLGEIVTRFTGETDYKMLEGVDIAIIGVPDDTGIKRNNGREGAGKAPDAVRRSFYKLTPGCEYSVDRLKIVDMGNVKIENDIERTHENVKKVVSGLVELGITPICIGGGHDITHPNTAGFIEGYRARGKGYADYKVGQINVDSHFDVRNMDYGITSGTPFFRTLELPGGPVPGKNFVELGIQEHHNSPAHYKYLVGKGSNVLFLEEVQSNGIDKAMKKAFKLAGMGTKATCVSFDIDSGCMADVPGASASYPNGLSARELERAAYLTGKTPKVGMMDMMEICPPLDIDDRTSKLGASMMFYFLKGFAERERG